jgi:hypothetical protein
MKDRPMGGEETGEWMTNEQENVKGFRASEESGADKTYR